MDDRRYTYLVYGPVLVAMIVGAMLTLMAGVVAADPQTFGLDSRTRSVICTVILAALTGGLVWVLNERMKSGVAQVTLGEMAIGTPRNAMTGRLARWDYAAIADAQFYTQRDTRILQITHLNGEKIGIPRSALVTDADFDDLTVELLRRISAARSNA